MIKILEIEVKDTCEGCPYLRYDPHYSMSYDSGYDCSKNHIRIANDCEITMYEKRMKEIKEQNKGLFKFDGEMPKDPLAIPDDCPLPTKTV